MSNHTFTKHLAVTDGPWRVQDPHRGIVMDVQDRRIATVPKAGEVPFPERQANLHAIACAPELLGALREAAYAIECLGGELKPEFYDLINRASPDAPVLVPKRVREAGSSAMLYSANDDNSADTIPAQAPTTVDPTTTAIDPLDTHDSAAEPPTPPKA